MSLELLLQLKLPLVLLLMKLFRLANIFLFIAIISITAINGSFENVIKPLFVAIPIIVLSYFGIKNKQTDNSSDNIEKPQPKSKSKVSLFLFLMQIGILIALIYGKEISILFYAIYFIVLFIASMYISFRNLLTMSSEELK